MWVHARTCQCLRMRFVGIKDVVSQATPFNLGEKAVVERVWSRDRCGGGKTGGRTIYRYVRNDIVRSASLPHRVLVKRNYAPISVLLPQVYTTPRGRVGDLTAI